MELTFICTHCKKEKPVREACEWDFSKDYFSCYDCSIPKINFAKGEKHDE